MDRRILRDSDRNGRLQKGDKRTKAGGKENKELGDGSVESGPVKPPDFMKNAFYEKLQDRVQQQLEGKTSSGKPEAGPLTEEHQDALIAIYKSKPYGTVHREGGGAIDDLSGSDAPKHEAEIAKLRAFASTKEGREALDSYVSAEGDEAKLSAAGSFGGAYVEYVRNIEKREGTDKPESRLTEKQQESLDAYYKTDDYKELVSSTLEKVQKDHPEITEEHMHELLKENINTLLLSEEGKEYRAALTEDSVMPEATDRLPHDKKPKSEKRPTTLHEKLQHFVNEAYGNPFSWQGMLVNVSQGLADKSKQAEETVISIMAELSGQNIPGDGGGGSSSGQPMMPMMPGGDQFRDAEAKHQAKVDETRQKIDTFRRGEKRPRSEMGDTNTEEIEGPDNPSKKRKPLGEVSSNTKRKPPTSASEKVVNRLDYVLD